MPNSGYPEKRMSERFLRTHRILWLALIVSLGFYGVVATIVPLGSGVPAAAHLLVSIFIGLSVVILVIAQWLRVRLMPPLAPPTSLGDVLHEQDTPEARRALSQLSITYIVSWALSEAVGMLGLIATFVVHQQVYFVGFSAVAFLFLLLYRPDPDEVTGALRGACKS
jgi:hypothetical protein